MPTFATKGGSCSQSGWANPWSHGMIFKKNMDIDTFGQRSSATSQLASWLTGQLIRFCIGFCPAVCRLQRQCEVGKSWLLFTMFALPVEFDLVLEEAAVEAGDIWG